MIVDRRTTREVLGASLVVMIVGNLMYALASNVWLLLAGRFIVGIATGKFELRYYFSIRVDASVR